MPSRAMIKISGHVGRDPEMKESKNHKPFVVFSVAVSNGYKDKQTQEWVKENSDWYQVMSYRDTQSIMEHVRKGVGVTVTGKPKFKAYINKNSNLPVPDLAIFANEVSIILYDKKESSGGYGGTAFADNIDTEMMNLGDDTGGYSDFGESDIPF
jgi:single-strand DNA-binding protein